MKNKSNQVRELVASKEFKKALAIVKGFRIGLTMEQISTFTRAHECIVHPGFYSQIGMNEEQEIQKGIDLLVKLYGSE